MAKQSPSRPVSDFILLIFSLFLGFIVWVIVRQQDILTQTIIVPVDIQDLPAYIELDPEQPYEPTNMAVSFSFPKGSERLAESPDFRLTVDASELATMVSSTRTFTPHSLRVSRNNVQFPNRLTFVEFVSQPEVEFSARLRVASARVVPTIAGDGVAEGYRLDTENITVDPGEIDVAVDARRSSIAAEEGITVQTEPININDADRSFQVSVGILFAEEAGIYPMPGRRTETIEVRIPVPEIEQVRTFEDIPIQHETILRGVRAVMEPATADVTVTGPLRLVQTVDEEMIRLTPRSNEFLDAETAGESFETIIDVTVNIPNTENRDRLRTIVDPQRVQVTFVAVAEPTPEPTPTPKPAPDPTPEPTPEPQPEAESAPEEPQP